MRAARSVSPGAVLAPEPPLYIANVALGIVDSVLGAPPVAFSVSAFAAKLLDATANLLLLRISQAFGT